MLLKTRNGQLKKVEVFYLSQKPKKSGERNKKSHFAVNHYNAENRKTRQDSNALALICMIKLRSHPPSRS